MAHNFDLIVIGSGPAGEKGAAQAAYFGKRVAVIERAPEPGGACVHTGTLPSKTLREAALVLSGYRNRELYGIRMELDRERATPRMLSRKEVVRCAEVDRIRRNLDRHHVTPVSGEGKIIDPHTVAVGAETLSAEVILIAVGSSPHRPELIAFDDKDIDDSDTILNIDRLPDRMTILGAGVIGCEYACMFAALGVEIHLVESRDVLLPFLDREIAEKLTDAMRSMGVKIHFSRRFETVARIDPRIIRTTLSDGSTIDADKLLYCTGRSGNTAKLGLENVGIVSDKRGLLTVDEHYRTTVPSIYAVGDVIGFPALASTSMEQARVAMVHAFDLGYKTTIGRFLPYGIYTIPEASVVGLTQEEAQAKGIDHVIGRAFFRENTRGQIEGERDGMLKLVFERKTRRLLGVHCLCENASELVHIGQAILTLGGGVDTLIEMVFNHPTLSESYKYAAYDALGRWRAEP